MRLTNLADRHNACTRSYRPTFRTAMEDLLTRVLRAFRNRFYKVRGLKYGLIEAIFFPNIIDGWQRYAAVIDELKEGRCDTILDVGAGAGAILKFGKFSNYSMCLLDINRDALSTVKRKADAVVGDGTKLPFRSGSFNACVNVDTVEHVSRGPSRRELLRELRRVAKNRVVMHMPITDSESMFSAYEYDIKLHNALIRNFEIEDKNLIEHLKCGHPTISEIREEFPTAIFKGLQNCDVWYITMLLQRSKVSVFAGFIYLLFLRRRDFKSPFYGALIAYEKDDLNHKQRAQSNK